jgi:hypothetical protein
MPVGMLESDSAGQCPINVKLAIYTHVDVDVDLDVDLDD